MSFRRGAARGGRTGKTERQSTFGLKKGPRAGVKKGGEEKELSHRDGQKRIRTTVRFHLSWRPD